MAATNNPQEAALLAHVVSQIELNVDFLVKQNYISATDASAIMSRLPMGHTETPVVADPSKRLRSVLTPATSGRREVPPPPTRNSVTQVRALWGYNENEKESDDLSFSPGDIIELVSEVNNDWWMGKLHGKQALFPSAYVEHISTPVAPAAERRLPLVVQPANSEKSTYKPFMAVHHGADAPPAAGLGSVNSVGLQQDPVQEQKKSKFGKYGNTMAHSAAGGVGFGAGAAIGGGLVRAIF